MFDVRKLAELLREIFTRDNENFSPELIAEELENRHLGIIDEIEGNESLSSITSGCDNVAVGRSSLPYGYLAGMGFNPNYKEHSAAGPDALVNYRSNLNYGGPYILDTTNKGERHIGIYADNKEVVDCVVIGKYSTCTHNNSVVIGTNQKSDKPNQLKIGNNDISVSRDITDEEFKEILATFKSVREFLPSKPCNPTGIGYDVTYNLK